jgi:AraC-like DNA-binding protein
MALATTIGDHAVADDAYVIRHLEVGGALRDMVRALIGVEVRVPGPIPLAVAPQDAMVLSVEFGRGSDPIERKGEPGLNTRLTGIRNETGRFHGAGDCVTLFALLTPIGAVRLLEGRPLGDAPRIRAQLALLLDQALTCALERDLASAPDLEARLRSFAHWLETRALRQRENDRAALRVGRAATRLCSEPGADIERLAAEQHVSRRQLERDFARWIGTSPRHLAQVARLQGVSRKACRGASLADIAADVGFADQAHMSRVVRSLTGLTPLRFIRASSPLTSAFREATGGNTVYL